MPQDDSVDEEKAALAYISEFEAALAELETNYGEVKDKYDTAVKKLNKNFLDIDSALAKQKGLAKDTKECLLLLEEAREAIGERRMERFEERIHTVGKYAEFLGKTKRKVGSNFLRYVMGHVSVRVWNESEKIELKLEYNKFKNWGAFACVIMPLVQLLIGFSWIVHQWQQGFFIYYYFSLALRENVLKLNGSRIKRWWIVHHYLSMFTAFISLLLCRSAYDDYEAVFSYMTYFALWHGCVMWVQNQYQEARHYQRIAMGKASIYDGTTSETLTEAPSSFTTWYYILIPLLYMTYAFEMILGVFLFVEFVHKYNIYPNFRLFEFEVLMLSSLWLLISFGNMSTTTQTLYEKKESERRRRISIRYSQSISLDPDKGVKLD